MINFESNLVCDQANALKSKIKHNCEHEINMQIWFCRENTFFIICSVIISSQIGCFSWFHYILKYRPSFWWVRAHSLFLKNFSVALQVTQSWRLCSRGANLCHKWLNFTWIVSLMDASNNTSKHCLVYFMF